MFRLNFIYICIYDFKEAGTNVICPSQGVFAQL